jgi:hypothetical protein
MSLKAVFRAVVVLFLLLVASVSVAVVMVDRWAPTFVGGFIHKKTAFDLKIGSFNTTPLLQSLVVKNAVLSNPSSFPERDFVQINELSVRANPLTFLTQSPVIDSLSIGINQLTIVRSKTGDINIQTFADAFKAPPSAETEQNKSSAFLIRDLLVRLETIQVIDYQQNPPLIKSYPLHLVREFRDITDFTDVATAFAVDLSVVGISFVTDSIRNSLKSNKILKAIPKVNNALDKAFKQTKGILDQLLPNKE